MQLNTNHLILDELTLDDLANLHRLNSCPEVDEFNTLGIPSNIEETKVHLEGYIQAQKANPRVSFNWKIIDRQNNTFVGAAGINLSNNRFKLGIMYYNILPSYWGKGYATEVGKCLVKFGFEELHLHKVEAGVQTENIRSIRVLEKIGMTREGLRRKILPIRGEWKDNYHYAIVEDDPKAY
ncbi:MAG: GNAT family N-acetyltransferase [Prolixibacteraceae bacterium]